LAGQAHQPRQRAGAPPLALNPFAATICRTIARLRRQPSAFDARLADFDRRIAEARAKHQAVRHIEAERRDFVHACLRGAR